MATSESIIRLAKAVRENLERGMDAGGQISGSPGNHCCASCEALYNALIEVEKEYDIAPSA